MTDFLRELEGDGKADNKTKNGAHALKKKMLSFDFVVSLYFMKNIIYKIQMMTKILEGMAAAIPSRIFVIIPMGKEKRERL